MGSNLYEDCQFTVVTAFAFGGGKSPCFTLVILTGKELVHPPVERRKHKSAQRYTYPALAL
jgi:hypothetical protein